MRAFAEWMLPISYRRHHKIHVCVSGLWVYGVGEDGVPAFTKDGIDNLRQIIADQRAAGRAPPELKSDE